MTYLNANSQANLPQKGCLFVTLLTIGSILASNAIAHSGGMNAQGCHSNRKTGEYHCHRSQERDVLMSRLIERDEPKGTRKLTQQFRSSQAQKHRGKEVPSPHCYTGPRGGTYTLTASGNKNYGGC